MKKDNPDMVFQMKKKRAFMNGVKSGNWDETSRSEEESVTSTHENLHHNF